MSATNDTMALLAHDFNGVALVAAMTLPAFCSFAFFLVSVGIIRLPLKLMPIFPGAVYSIT